MHTPKDIEFDYQVYMKQNPPEPKHMQRGLEGRQKRRGMAKRRITIRIDADILEQFKQMVPDGQGYQSLVNQALREWLMAQSVQELVRDELQALTAKAMACLEEAARRS